MFSFSFGLKGQRLIRISFPQFKVAATVPVMAAIADGLFLILAMLAVVYLAIAEATKRNFHGSLTPGRK